MFTQPQIGALHGKKYLSALALIIITAIFSFQTKGHAMAMGPYINLTENRVQLKARTNTWSAFSEKAVPTEKAMKVEDKKIDADDEQNKDFVREVIPLWEKKSLDKKSWSEHVYSELPKLGPDLLASNPRDAKIFCPNFENLSESERKQFWAFFISSMVKFESDFNPKVAYTEGFKDNRNKYVISRGLLQISIESSKGYHCKFADERELHDPLMNLSCGIKILNHWMKRDQRIASRSGISWKGGARYWSVLRQARKTSYMSIVKWSNDLPFCKL